MPFKYITTSITSWMSVIGLVMNATCKATRKATRKATCSLNIITQL